MRNAALGAAAAVMFTSVAVAQRQAGTTKKTPPTASVEGDVYILTQSGDTKKGSARIVWLLKDTGGLRDTVQASCVNAMQRQLSLLQYRKALIDSESIARAEKPGAPSIYDILSREARVDKGVKELKDEARANVLRSMLRTVVDSAGSGMNAHYRFSGVAPGKYVLFTEWKIGPNQYVWWAPVTVATGQAITRDLDNSVAIDGALLCM